MPYNPGVQYRGDLHLARGISGALGSITQGLEQRKQLNDTAKGMDTIMKANPDFLGQIGIDDETWRGMSSREKVAAGKGLFESMAMQEQAAKHKAVLAQIQAQTEAMNQNMRNDQIGTAQLGNIFAGLDGQPRNVTVPFGTGGAMSQHPIRQNNASLLAGNPMGAQRLPAGALNTILGGADNAQPKLQFIQDPNTGTPLAIFGNSIVKMDPKEPPPTLKPYEKVNVLKQLAEWEKEYNAMTGMDPASFTPAMGRQIKSLKDNIDTARRILNSQPDTVREQGREQLRGAGSDRVRVISPDGREGMIPAAQLEAALKQGYKRAGGN